MRQLVARHLWLRRTRRATSAVLVMLALHAGLLAWSAAEHSPTFDEVGHLPAGFSHWQLGQFELYRVNPPLVRMLAATPLLLCRPVTDWTYDRPAIRLEFTVAERFLKANGDGVFWYLTLARWACIPLSLVGGYVSFRWARDLYGTPAGFLALGLWCFDPSILGNGALITADVGAAALGVAAGYTFWRWLKRPNWPRSVAAGLVLGLAELTKTTWIVLFPLWPAMWLMWRMLGSRGQGSGVRDERVRSGEAGVRSAPAGSAEAGTPTDAGETPAPPWRREAAQMVVILALAVYTINLGYAFEDSGTRLGDFTFVSAALSGCSEETDPDLAAGNRFADTWLGAVPVPFPRNYISGIDLQRRDFEAHAPSFLAGQWSRDGWWYYYLFALGIKLPLGTWTVLLLAVCVSVWGRRGAQPDEAGTTAQPDEAGIPAHAGETRALRDELVLLLPVVVVLVLVSSQTGQNHHMRYVLPAFPFVFIWASKVARAATGNRVLAGLVLSAFAWSAAASLYYYPHSLSYFNELIGGPAHGPEYLHNSAVDWGQDVFYLKTWLDEHPEAQPLHMAFFGSFDPRLAGIEYLSVPPGPSRKYKPGEDALARLGPRPGWYAMSVNNLRSASGGGYAYFLEFQPVAMAGYSIYIYHITLDEANAVRERLGLDRLTSDGEPLESRL